MLATWLKKLEDKYPAYVGRAYALVNAFFQALLNFSSKKVKGK
jgi:hypothetical protein